MRSRIMHSRVRFIYMFLHKRIYSTFVHFYVFIAPVRTAFTRKKEKIARQSKPFIRTTSGVIVKMDPRFRKFPTEAIST